MPGNSSNFKVLFSIKLFEKSLILVKDIDNSKIIKIPYA